MNDLIDSKEQQIIDIIRNDDFREIVITKTDATTMTIRAKETKHGKFSSEDVLALIAKKDYQNIKVSKTHGQIVSVTREETIKI